jgi:hypothetical protein
LSWI